MNRSVGASWVSCAIAPCRHALRSPPPGAVRSPVPRPVKRGPPGSCAQFIRSVWSAGSDEPQPGEDRAPSWSRERPPTERLWPVQRSAKAGEMRVLPGERSRRLLFVARERRRRARRRSSARGVAKDTNQVFWLGHWVCPLGYVEGRPRASAVYRCVGPKRASTWEALSGSGSRDPLA